MQVGYYGQKMIWAVEAEESIQLTDIRGISALEICLRNIFVPVRQPRHFFPGTKLQITREGGRKPSDRLLNLEACVTRINRGDPWKH